MTTILHMSDPHFGTERAPVVEALVELVRSLGPELVVLSGDITQRARAAQFAAAAAFVERLGVPKVLAIPGNHDISLYDPLSRLLWPYAGFCRTFGAELEPSWSAADCLVLGVKTTRRYRHVDGEISEAQCASVAARLRQAHPEQLRVVVVHQPLAVPRESEHKNLIRGHRAAIESWAAAGADLVLGGHIHLPFLLPLHAENPNLPRHLWAVNAGTALSTRIRNDVGNSVNVIRISTPAAPSCSVERWDFNSPEAGFTCESRQQLSCGPR